MKNKELHHGGNWLDRLLNSFPFLIDTDYIKPLMEFGWGGNEHTDQKPDFLGFRLRFWKWCSTDSMYRNNIFYFRLLFPFGIFFMVRWSGSKTKKAFLQAGLGWKLNGRFAATFRIQSDQTSAEGVSGPNVGQAQGWKEGAH